MSLYVTYIDNPINNTKPNICMLISVLSFKGFLLIASNNNKTNLPPSSGGNGNKFVTPSDIDINAKI